jgi:hypothetical protein
VRCVLVEFDGLRHHIHWPDYNPADVAARLTKLLPPR